MFNKIKKYKSLIIVLVLVVAVVLLAKSGKLNGILDFFSGEEDTADTGISIVTDGTEGTSSQKTTEHHETSPPETGEEKITEDGKYYSKNDVALYIHTYGKLPSNFVTKSKAQDAGWQGGSVEQYLSECAIGGDRFGNNEGLLPKKKGRTYYECDIDTNGQSSRGTKRIIFSDDGLIYYTSDHYESFILLYGDPNK